MSSSRSCRSNLRKENARIRKEIAALEKRLKELEGLRCQLPEDVLTLSILENAPFTVWACRRDFSIVLWNKLCEEQYACTKSQALGKNFFDVFVDDLERDQAKKDCLSIIDNAVTFYNFIADDHDISGKPIKMLTNCFRVFDPRTAEFVQAEIGIDISALKFSEERHRNIKDLARSFHIVKAQAESLDFSMTQMSLRMQLKDIKFEKRATWDEKNNEITVRRNKLHQHVNEAARLKLSDEVAQWSQVWVSIKRRIDEFEAAVLRAREMPELIQLQREVNIYGEESLNHLPP